MAIHERPFDSLEQLHESELGYLELMFESGTQLAVTATLNYCAKHRLTPPNWVVTESVKLQCALLRGDAPQKRGRSAGSVRRYRQDAIDFVRWDVVVEVKEKREFLKDEIRKLKGLAGLSALEIRIYHEKLLRWTGTNDQHAFECASMLLRGRPAHGGPDAIRTSYRTVVRNMRNLQTAMRYRIFDLDFLRKIDGVVEEPVPVKGKKLVPLFDLTI